jgi:catechol 2,3-dioxygenase-like lactoylglutathione lyase family enzyme
MMSIRRVVPDIKSQHLAESRAFYVDVLGLTLAMDLGFVMTFVSPSAWCEMSPFAATMPPDAGA